MPFDSEEQFNIALAHFIEYAQIPAWKEEIWREAQEAAKDPSRQFAGIDQRLVYEMKRLNARSTD